ncbi:hypothetical protein HYE67_009841 [Fusarium culmorum]|uniref:Uncharacterized protein n=1 Tax=Fusarium culmorum TaxID=5516 RepID=A0A7S8DFI7_FUSCU|nr:hypothetical protein HYE67_009841 [Fusarium culmorum]
MKTESPTPDGMYRADGTNEPGSSDTHSGLQDTITIDSDSDSDGSDLSSCIPSSDTFDGSDLPTRVKEFSERCLNSLPLNFMTAEFKNYIFYNSNQRLDEAKASSVDLDDIAVGDDCLPTWSGRSWDPTTESLHGIIQSRLATQDEAQQAGKLARDDIIWKTGVKLYEASVQGIPLEDIYIAAEDAIRYLYHEDDNEQQTPDEDEGWILPTPDFETEQVHDTGAVSLSQSTTFVSSDDSTSLSLMSPCFSNTDSDSDIGSDIDSESDPDIDSDDVEDFDDTFSIDNMFDPEPHYLDSDDEEEPNIFHGAHVVGLPSQHANVDLEMYEASDEDEVEDLPEMELCIDGELYKALFDIEGVIDVEIEGSRIICTGELFEEGEEIIVDGPEDDGAGPAVYEDQYSSASESPKENTGDRMILDTGYEAGDGRLFNSWEGSSWGQATQHESLDNTFRETEDGFVW